MVGNPARRTSALALCAAVLLTGCAGDAFTPRGGPGPERKADVSPETVRFAVIGDTGVLPPDGNLLLTTRALADDCRSRGGCDFALLSGDNIYPRGASGDPAVDGPIFEKLLTVPFAKFGAENPGAPIIAALGNHDWWTSRRGAQAQVSFLGSARPFYMDGFFYRTLASSKEGGIEVFVIDTEMLLSSEVLTEFSVTPSGAMADTGRTQAGGSPNAAPESRLERQQIAWLEGALERSTARWKLVLGHHPLWQSRGDSKFAQAHRLRELLLPTLCRHADGYFAGHQHTIEVSGDDCSSVPVEKHRGPLPVIVSGAGAKARAVDPEFARWQSRTFPQMTSYISAGSTSGFVRVTIDGQYMTLEAVETTPDGLRSAIGSARFPNRD